MNKFVKKHIGLIIVLLILIVFPASLSNQAKLNMRIIVTGLAIDKVENEYEVTAQIVKTVSGTESPGTGAEIEFISDRAETVSKAISKLLYKAGKVSAFSHTNFLILGKSILSEDATKCLDVFLRDKVIKNSAMILFSKGSAKDEIQKTKNLELSVGLGLQKVYSFKQEESNGLMKTVLEFINENTTYGKTAVASVFELISNDTSGDENDSASDSGGLSQDSNFIGLIDGESSSESDENSSGESSQSGSSGSGENSSGSSGGSNSGGEAENSKVYFTPNAPTVIFVNGKYAMTISDDDENEGFMLAQQKTKTKYIEVQDFENENLKDTKITVIIKRKQVHQKIKFNNQNPCLHLSIIIDNSEINEVSSSKENKQLGLSEIEDVKNAIKKKIEKDIGKVFENAKNNGADIFNAYETAYKFNFKTLTKFYDNFEDFIKNLTISVDVKIVGLEY